MYKNIPQSLKNHPLLIVDGSIRSPACLRLESVMFSGEMKDVYVDPTVLEVEETIRVEFESVEYANSNFCHFSRRNFKQIFL